MTYNNKTAILQAGIYLDENTRIRATYSQTFSFTREMADFCAGVFVLRQSRFMDYTVDVHGMNSELERVQEEEDGNPTGDTELVLKGFLRANGYYAQKMELRGASAGEWADVIIYQKIWQITEETQNYVRDSFAGDVFDLFLETKKTYTAENGDTLEEWATDFWHPQEVVSENLWRETVNIYGMELARAGYDLGRFILGMPRRIREDVTATITRQNELFAMEVQFWNLSMDDDGQKTATKENRTRFLSLSSYEVIGLLVDFGSQEFLNA